MKTNIMSKRVNRESKSQTLDKAFLILDSFTCENPEWGIRELGRVLGMTPTTIYRIISTLCSAAYLEQNPETHRYSLGPKVVKLASIYARINPLPEIALKIFEKYSDRFEYNFYMGRLSNFEVINLAVLDGRGPLKVVVDPGGSTFLHSTALGKVLLAYQDDAFISKFLDRAPLNAYTERSITDPDHLRSQLKQIRIQAYAVNDGEQYDAIGAVGVPIIGKSGHVHLGVSLAYPRRLIQKDDFDLYDLVQIAKEIANEIRLHIGDF